MCMKIKNICVYNWLTNINYYICIPVSGRMSCRGQSLGVVTGRRCVPGLRVPPSAALSVTGSQKLEPFGFCGFGSDSGTRLFYKMLRFSVPIIWNVKIRFRLDSDSRYFKGFRAPKPDFFRFGSGPCLGVVNKPPFSKDYIKNFHSYTIVAVL